MCLIAWCWRPHAATPLIVIGNRDEFHDRPTLPLARWDDAPIWAGRDQVGGGSWMGVSESGRFAALTNFRAPDAMDPDKPTRGQLVRDFLAADSRAQDHLDQLATQTHRYNGFNLLVFDGQTLLGLEGRGQQARLRRFDPGVGQVSNGDFLAPWPKGLWLAQQWESALQDPTLNPTHWLGLLQNDQPAPDTALPQTGVGLERERALSAVFVRMGKYGTRASTLVQRHTEHIELHERRFDAQGAHEETAHRVPIRV